MTTLRDQVLDVIYTLPRAYETLEEHERFEHRDLPRRARADLTRELERAKLRLLIDDDADPWLLVRVQKLRERLNAR